MNRINETLIVFLPSQVTSGRYCSNWSTSSRFSAKWGQIG